MRPEARQKLDRLFLGGALAVLVFTTLAFGGRDRWAEAVALGIGAPLVLVATLRAFLPGSETRRPYLTWLEWPALLFLGVLLLQIVTLPPGLLRSLWPKGDAIRTSVLPGWPREVDFGRYRTALERPLPAVATAGREWDSDHPLDIEAIYRDAGLRPSGPATEVPPRARTPEEPLPPFLHGASEPRGEFPAPRPLSIHPAATRFGLWKFLLYALLLWGTVGALRSQHAVAGFQWRIVAFGGIVGLIATVQWALDLQRVYGFVPPPSAVAWNFFGPFFNANHYAGFAEMLAPVALGIAMSRMTRPLRKVLAAGIGFLLLFTVFLTASRAGMIAAVAGIAVFSAGLLPGGRRSRWLPVAILLLLALLLAGTIGIAGWQRVAEELASLGQVDRAPRWTIYRDGLRMWGDAPLFGVGLGAFPVAYPAYQSIETFSRVAYLENDVLQLLVETGAVGGLAGLAAVALFLARIAPFLRRGFPSLLLGPVAGIAALFAHSWIDFNLHETSNAVLFALLLGTAVAASREFGATWPARKPKPRVAPGPDLLVPDPAVQTLEDLRNRKF